MLTNICRRVALRNNIRLFSNLAAAPEPEPEAEAIEPEIEGTGWNANDKWTQLLREEKESETPKTRMYHKKRNAFYKLGYNENHIPNQSK